MDIRKITIGTDPEFIVLDDEGLPISARLVHLTRNEGFGGDNHLFEVRSGYSHDVLQVVESIRTILKGATLRLKGLGETTWLAGHYQGGFSIGGHIHIGGISVHSHFLEDFVDCLGNVLIKGLSDYIDDLEQRKKRRKDGYGYIDDTREPVTRSIYPPMYDMYRCYRLEYRAPGSFLVSPTITFLNLILAKVTSMCYFNSENKYTPSYRKYFFFRKKDPTDILKDILGLMKRDTLICKEEDVALGVEILSSFLSKKPKIDWNKDFKEAWGI